MPSLRIQSQVHLETPSGERIQIVDPTTDRLQVHCASARSVRELLRLTATLPFYRGIANLRRFTNPLAQSIELRVQDRLWLHWPAGERAQVKSWRLLLAWLRK